MAPGLLLQKRILVKKLAHRHLLWDSEGVPEGSISDMYREAENSSDPIHVPSLGFPTLVSKTQEIEFLYEDEACVH